MTTAYTLFLFGALFAAAILLPAVALRWAARRAGVENATWGRAMAVPFVVVLLAVPIGGVMAIAITLAQQSVPTNPIATLVAERTVSFGLSLAAVALLFRGTWRQRLIATAAMVAVNYAMVGITSLIVKPYLAESYRIPTNSMAPTILGRHWSAPCPRCGAPAYCSFPDRYDWVDPAGILMICSREYRTCRVQLDQSALSAASRQEASSGDRILVNKLLMPRRWEVAVFRYPDDPSVMYVKRVVGLPGETVVIRDGAVHINGEKLDPPESIREIEYLSEMEHAGELWGTENRPAVLGNDEYFMLGDFSACAKDSRLWERGAPGHPPYAVPRSYLQGVATHIYWPPARVRVLR